MNTPRTARTAFSRIEGRLVKVVQCRLCGTWMDPTLEGYRRDETIDRVASGIMSDPVATGLEDVTICTSCEQG